MSIELFVTTSYHRDMTEKLLKATLNQNKQTNNPQICVGIKLVLDLFV